MLASAIDSPSNNLQTLLSFRKKKKTVTSEEEEGEVKDDDTQHPLVSVTKIDPDEIPDIPSNKFLMRSDSRKSVEKDERKNKERRDDYRDRDHGRKFMGGWNRRFDRRPPKTKSGRIIKGRGVFVSFILVHSFKIKTLIIKNSIYNLNFSHRPSPGHAILTSF